MLKTQNKSQIYFYVLKMDGETNLIYIDNMVNCALSSVITL